MKKEFVICINNEGYEVSLEKGKVHQTQSDKAAQKRGLVRVIDESGDDHLFPKALFVVIRLPKEAEQALVA
jgi:hypothetical protein